MIRARGWTGYRRWTCSGLWCSRSQGSNALSALPDEQIIAQLTKVPGIGPWTVQGALILGLNRADVVLPGDLALRKAVRNAYQLDHLPTPAEVLAIAEPWRPYRSLATLYLFRAGEATVAPQ